MKLIQNTICVDIETTDSNPEIGSIIQLSGIVVGKDFKPMFAREFDTYIKPLDEYRNIQAMQVNGISEENLINAPSLYEALEMFESFCGYDKLLAAWGSYFDVPFLRKQYDKIRRRWPFGHKSFDLKSIAIWETSKKGIDDVKGGLSGYLEMNGEVFTGTKHNSLDDIKNTVKLMNSFI